MSKYLCFLLLLMTLLSNSQVIDYLNPQFKGKVKSAHYTVYFDAGKNDFAEPYDGEIVKEYQYSFDKEGRLEAILEIQNAGDCPFTLEFDNGKIKNFQQKLWNGNVLQEGKINWSSNFYEMISNDVFKDTIKKKFVFNSKNEIEKVTVETYDQSGLSKSVESNIIREQSIVKKISSAISYPNQSSIKQCETQILDAKYDAKGNLIEYRSKDSCSATSEKHKMDIVYWQ